MSFFQVDTFLSESMGVPAFYVPAMATNKELEAFRADLDSLSGNQSFFASMKINVRDVQAVERAIRSGFSLIDTNITLEKSIDDSPFALCDVSVRLACPQDKASVQQIAHESFQYSRFHLDPKIGPVMAARIKKAWAGNFFSGNRGDVLLVAEDESGLVGFALLLHTAESLVIDLIAVDKRVRRRGVGQALIGGAMTMGKQFSSIKVGTQIANYEATRFYETLGFKLVSASYVLHSHGR